MPSSMHMGERCGAFCTGVAGGLRGLLKDAVRLPANQKPLALMLRESSLLSVIDSFEASSTHLDALWAWCTRLPKQAISVQLYLSHLKFLLMAAGEH